MAYYIDLSGISLEEYKETLKSNYLIPSWRALRDNIDGNFELLTSHGFNNVQDLMSGLKTKNNFSKTQNKTNIDTGYLTILRRAVSSLHPPKRKINEYPTLSNQTKNKLIDMNIKTSKDLYDYIVELNDIDLLCKKLLEDSNNVIHMARLVDITRLRYVSPVYATVFALSKYNSVEKLRSALPEDLQNEILTVNEGNKYYKGNLGQNDFIFLIQDTQYVVSDIKFI